MTKRQRAWFGGVLAVLALVVAIAVVQSASPISRANVDARPASPATQPLQRITIGGHSVRVTIVDTDAARERGLGGRTGLAPDEGMLFVFPQDGTYRFWMKDMSFPIDILWLDAEGNVLYIQPNLAPDSYPNTYGPTTPARYVLELSANYAAEHGITVGSNAQLDTSTLPNSPASK